MLQAECASADAALAGGDRRNLAVDHETEGLLKLVTPGTLPNDGKLIADERKPSGPVTVPATGGRIGVLLVNLGTPDATSYWPMRRYLKEFLSDRR